MECLILPPAEAPRRPWIASGASKMIPRHVPEKSKNRFFHNVVQFARFPMPSWGIFAQHGRRNASKMPPRASKVCLRPSRPLPKSASKSLLLRPSPFTKGGLAVVRPRRPSSIKSKSSFSHLGLPQLTRLRTLQQPYFLQSTLRGT